MAFKKGQGGRPLGAGNKATKPLRDVLDALAVDDKDKKTDLHAKRLHDLTQSSDEHVAVKALTVVMAYRYGKPSEHMTVTDPNGGPLTVRFELVGVGA